MEISTAGKPVEKRIFLLKNLLALPFVVFLLVCASYWLSFLITVFILFLFKPVSELAAKIIHISILGSLLMVMLFILFDLCRKLYFEYCSDYTLKVDDEKFYVINNKNQHTKKWAKEKIEQIGSSAEYGFYVRLKNNKEPLFFAQTIRSKNLQDIDQFAADNGLVLEKETFIDGEKLKENKNFQDLFLCVSEKTEGKRLSYDLTGEAETLTYKIFSFLFIIIGGMACLPVAAFIFSIIKPPEGTVSRIAIVTILGLVSFFFVSIALFFIIGRIKLEYKKHFNEFILFSGVLGIGTRKRFIPENVQDIYIHIEDGAGTSKQYLVIIVLPNSKIIKINPLKSLLDAEVFYWFIRGKMTDDNPMEENKKITEQ